MAISDGKPQFLTGVPIFENKKIYLFLDFGIVTCSNKEMLIKVLGIMMG